MKEINFFVKSGAYFCRIGILQTSHNASLNIAETRGQDKLSVGRELCGGARRVLLRVFCSVVINGGRTSRADYFQLLKKQGNYFYTDANNPSICCKGFLFTRFPRFLKRGGGLIRVLDSRLCKPRRTRSRCRLPKQIHKSRS